MRKLRRITGSSLSAFGMHCSLGTLRALERKGLVTHKRGLVSLFSPRTDIRWSLTEKGETS